VGLEEGARVQLGNAVLLRFALQDETELEASRRMYEATVRDPLTGVYNRHFLDERLRSELSYAKRHGTSISVLFVDADHFKRVNDTYGHAAGDEVLRRLAAALVETLRNEDVVARVGGEEFVLVLRGIASVGVLAVAERIRAEIESMEIVHEGRQIPLTVSIGAATQSPEREFESVEELIAVADGALYHAKEAGRNSVFLA
jgi:diguanylate cyclase (GGDEF)-like protein